MGQHYVSGRRRGSGAFQWLIIGLFAGLMCGFFLFFILLATDTLPTLGEPDVVTQVVTQEIRVVEVVTATPDPNITAEVAVQVVTTTPEPTIETDAVVVPASATPIVVETEAVAVLATDVPDTPVSVDSQETASEEPSQQQVTIPSPLAQIITQMVTIPGGIFELGTTNQEIVETAVNCQERDGGNCPPTDGQDSTPIVRIELTGFQMEQTEVTFEQYVTFLNWLSSQGQRHTTACSGFICIQTTNENPENAVITFDSANYNVPPGLLSHPAYGVTWYGAEAYCRAIGRRLPSEVEWEYAARNGGDRRSYPWGNDFSSLNANTRIPIDGPQGTVPVGGLVGGRTPGGLYDMAGNVAEWVNDWYDPNYYSQTASLPQPVANPSGPISGLQKVLRGGSWNTFPFYSRTYHRQSWVPVPEPNNDPNWPRWTGFRCAADLGVDAPGWFGRGRPSRSGDSV
ncbi:MAG: SUMF1/EgtB/PvdO family nonheme iron enzyme [Anaerolineae bacterium]|nr:SUMF1/EgtB/PvdO family nonheme iron enzyme [Anaerolineae bacterium]